MNEPGRDEPDLIRDLIAGDESALARLYDRYAGAVYRTAYRLLQDYGGAEEVVQETMLTLWDRAESYDAEVASLGAWLGAIARNRAIDRLRARARRIAPISIASVLPESDGGSAADDLVLEAGTLVGAGRREPEPDAAGEAAWLRQTLGSAIASLPMPERRVIELAYAGDLTQTEIAAVLGWPLGTVKTRTRRAMARLRVALGGVLAPEASMPAIGRAEAGRPTSST